MTILILRYAIGLIFLMNSDLLFAAEISKCQRSARSAKMKCLIIYKQEVKVKKPRQVVVRDNNGYWVATGRVFRASKNGVIAFFSSSDPIRKGYKATFKSRTQQNTIDYGSAFN